MSDAVSAVQGASHLQHHFETPAQQAESAKLAIWIFLATELLFFSGLFCAYAVYRANHPEIFVYAHRFLDKRLGGMNTLVLILSSLTMALAVRAAQLSRRKTVMLFLAATMALGCVFLGVKYVEYNAKWEHGLLWGKQYAPKAHHGGAEPAKEPGDSDLIGKIEKMKSGTRAPGGLAPEFSAGHEGAKEPHNVQLFFSIYFVMTGLHGIHVIVGILVIGWLFFRALAGEFGDGYATPVDVVGLYWHLVDIIWIFLFPLLYLIH